MNIPKDYNTRAEAMWRIISQRVDFRQKNVIDLGCGHGEMLWRCYVAGAEQIIGIDEKWEDVPEYLSTFYPEEFKIITGDLNETPTSAWIKNLSALGWNKPDIAICFSVLPYLDDSKAFTQWMANTFRECLIEAQYIPEPYNIGVSNDDEMHKWLRECGFEVAIPLGKTYIEIRDVDRTIWYATREKKPLGLK